MNNIGITISADVPDQDRADDIMTMLNNILPFMADNVSIELDEAADFEEDADICKRKAERLVNAVNALGLVAMLHWDRSPWMCRVALTNIAAWSDATPSIYVYVEDTDTFRIRPSTDIGHAIHTDAERGWRWHAQLSNEEYYDLGFEFLERTWLGDSELTVATEVAKLVGMIDVSGWPQDS
jgi:hypothetical protein